MQATSQAGGRKRKGVILLVVLAMITLLTILGITFVMYADSSEATARINMESEKIHQVDWTGNELMQLAFGQLVFDVEDDELGQQSGMRGHSLARDMYGYRYGATTGQIENNDRPFRGTGRLNIPNPLTGLPDNQLINFSTFYMGANNPEQIRDPERLGARIDLSRPNAYVGGFNPPYTYPDLNHVFLARLGTDGQVDEPSFVRREAMGTLGQLYPLGTFNSGAWTDPQGKYKMVRPRQVDMATGVGEHPQFAPPGDGYGDVRNLPWGTHNDAVWVDLGVTPKTAANGKKYKPLFAYTILDLDGRVNLNAHGNIHGRDATTGTPNQTHASRDGMGPWEVNLGKALTNPNLTQFFSIRRDSNSFFSLQSPYPQHTHGPLDGNGSLDSPGAVLGPLALPGASSGSFLSPFGWFVTQIYGGMGPNEIANHGALFTPFDNFTGNKLFGHGQLGLLMGRSLRSPSTWQNSELYNLGLFGTASPFPLNGQNRDPRFDRVTTLSWDLDRPGMVPYLTDRRIQSPFLNPMTNWVPNISTGASTDYPGSNNAVTFPNLPLVATNDPNSEFDSLAQSKLALHQRLNLRRYLTLFPPIDTATGLYTESLQAQRALVERQQFAQDIFNHLALATGILTPNDAGFPSLAQLPDPGYNASKWLAQLAANIVDYIDSDEVMTVFRWNQNTDAVFGVELARLALNELFVQVENHPADAAAGQKKPMNAFQGKVYVELVNPLLSNNGSTIDIHAATLQTGNQSVHVLELVKPTALPSLRDITQTTGIVGPVDPALILSQTSWDFPAAVMPAGESFLASAGAGLSAGFVVVGPAPDAQASDITNTRWTTAATLAVGGDIIHQNLSFPLPKSTQKLDTTPSVDIPWVLLRRLAIPGLAHQPDPTNLTLPYNPYVTTDMAQITQQMLVDNDARKIIDDPLKLATVVNTNPNKVMVTARKSYGRSQPYFSIPAAAFNGQAQMQIYGTLLPQSPANPVTGGPMCTFWRHNTLADTAPVVYKAPVVYPFVPGGETFETPRFRPHLDRWPSTVGEILSTPTCRAHEVVLLNDARASYCAGWHDPSSRLYRFLELAQAGNTRNLMAGSNTIVVPVGAEGGRIPGKINVNTMTKEVFKALCDAQQTTNRFSDQQVDQIYEYLQANRPYWGFGMGEFSDPNGDFLSKTKRGMNQTLMRHHPGGVPSFNPADGNPNDQTDMVNLMLDAQNANNNGGQLLPVIGTSRFGMGGAMDLPPAVRQELLSKIIGNTTSRSNCFAVWVTVGYFEVTQEGWTAGATNPTPKHILGMEMQPRTRRRFFSMIDRTQLEAWRVELDSRIIINSAGGTSTDSGQFISPVRFELSKLTTTDGTTFSNPNGMLNDMTGKRYPIQAGSVLTFDPGTLWEETVEVVDLGGGTIGVYLRKPHGVSGGPVTVCSRGNPGPIPFRQLDVSDLQKKGLIPYFQVLE